MVKIISIYCAHCQEWHEIDEIPDIDVNLRGQRVLRCPKSPFGFDLAIVEDD